MKLLEDLSATTKTPRPPRRRVLVTMLLTLLLVLIAAYVGFTMLTNAADEPDENAPVPMTAWVEEATTTCVAVAEEHPVLTQSSQVRLDDSNVAAVEAGVTTLTARLRELPSVEDVAEQERISEILAVADGAAEAWQALDADSAGEDELSDASTMISTLVDGLVDLGADCAILD